MPSYMFFYYHETTLIASGVAGVRASEDLDELDSKTCLSCHAIDIYVPCPLHLLVYTLSCMLVFAQWYIFYRTRVFSTFSFGTGFR